MKDAPYLQPKYVPPTGFEFEPSFSVSGLGSGAGAGSVGPRCVEWPVFCISWDGNLALVFCLLHCEALHHVTVVHCDALYAMFPCVCVQ